LTDVRKSQTRRGGKSKIKKRKGKKGWQQMN
jgi:hypothetical protein